MAAVKLTIAGASRVKKVLSYDAIHIDFGSGVVRFCADNVGVAEMVLPPCKLTDSITICDLKGKLKVTGD